MSREISFLKESLIFHEKIYAEISCRTKAVNLKNEIFFYFEEKKGGNFNTFFYLTRFNLFSISLRLFFWVFFKFSYTKKIIKNEIKSNGLDRQFRNLIKKKRKKTNLSLLSIRSSCILQFTKKNSRIKIKRNKSNLNKYRVKNSEI